jgi:hypothetical protein
MMSHGATVKIENYLGYDMKLEPVTFGGKVCHGKYTSSPSPIIANQQTAEFRVSPVDGGSIGPKGWLTYYIDMQTEQEIIRIFWDHPVGSGRTRYEVSSQPYKIDYELVGKTTGTEQTITLKFNNIDLNTHQNIAAIDCNY